MRFDVLQNTILLQRMSKLSNIERLDFKRKAKNSKDLVFLQSRFKFYAKDLIKAISKDDINDKKLRVIIFYSSIVLA